MNLTQQGSIDDYVTFLKALVAFQASNLVDKSSYYLQLWKLSSTVPMHPRENQRLIFMILGVYHSLSVEENSSLLPSCLLRLAYQVGLQIERQSINPMKRLLTWFKEQYLKLRHWLNWKESPRRLDSFLSSHYPELHCLVKTAEIFPAKSFTQPTLSSILRAPHLTTLSASLSPAGMPERVLFLRSDLKERTFSIGSQDSCSSPNRDKIVTELSHYINSLSFQELLFPWVTGSDSSDFPFTTEHTSTMGERDLSQCLDALKESNYLKPGFFSTILQGSTGYRLKKELAPEGEAIIEQAIPEKKDALLFGPDDADGRKLRASVLRNFKKLPSHYQRQFVSCALAHFSEETLQLEGFPTLGELWTSALEKRNSSVTNPASAAHLETHALFSPEENEQKTPFR